MATIVLDMRERALFEALEPLAKGKPWALERKVLDIGDVWVFAKRTADVQEEECTQPGSGPAHGASGVGQGSAAAARGSRHRPA